VLKARDAVRDLPTYHPPLGGRKGLRLDFNENTVGCSPRVLARLRQLSAEEIACYPEREPVEAVVAAHLGIEPNELLLTNGVDEAIHLLCETFLEPGDEALIVVPTFAMYEISAAATGASVIGTASHQLQVLPSHPLWYSFPSVPKAKTSRLFQAFDTMVGAEPAVPLSFSYPSHPWHPVLHPTSLRYHFHQIPLSNPLTTTS